MKEPAICATCTQKPCRSSTERQVYVCGWGVSYFREGREVFKAETPNPLRYLSQNLRHELSRVIAILVRDANEIDPSLRSDEILLSNPASRIIGAANILDNFIEMISGVHSLHPMAHTAGESATKTSLINIINKYFDTYSMINNQQRNRNLHLIIDQNVKHEIIYNKKAIEYIISALMDNAWKYAMENSTIVVETSEVSNGAVDLYFSNYGREIPEEIDIFEIGAQANKESEGFGLGLHWATVLVDYYNEGINSADNPLQLKHRQHPEENGVWVHTFELSNLRTQLDP